MIRVAVFFLLILGAGKSIAQNTKFVSLYSMMQRTMMYNREEQAHKGIIRNMPTYAPSYGLTLSQNFNSWLGIDYGLFLSRVEQSFEIYGNSSADMYALKGRKRLLYVKVPIWAKVTLLSRPKNIFYIMGGPQVSMLWSEDGIIPIYKPDSLGQGGDVLYGYDISEAAGAYNRFNFELGAALGWQTKLYKNLYLMFLLRADCSLTDIENKSYSTVFYNEKIKDVYYIYSNKRPATHNIAFGGGIGLALKVR